MQVTHCTSAKLAHYNTQFYNKLITTLNNPHNLENEKFTKKY